MSIWRVKPVSAFEADMKKGGLNRVLTRWGLTSLGIGAIIGGGIFTLTGIAAHDYAGPALALSFVIAGIGCLFASLCYAEFASVLPVEGSAYAYAYGTIGEVFAWFIGWNLILEYMMGATTVAVAWSGYFTKLLGLFHLKLPLSLLSDKATAMEKLNHAKAVDAVKEYLTTHTAATFDQIKEHFANAEFASAFKSLTTIKDFQNFANGEGVAQFAEHYSSIDLSGIVFNLPAFLITWVITAILVKGIKEAAKTNNIIVIIKIAVVLFVIIAGAFFIDTDNWVPFIPAETKTIVDGVEKINFGFGGVLTAATIVFFAYIGFDAVSTQAGEAINPKKDVPFAIVASLVICTILYILVSLVLTGMVRFDQLDKAAPVASAFSGVGLTWATFLITIAATAGLMSVMLVMMLGQTRIFLGMSKDGLLPGFFKDLHPKYLTPHKSTLLVGLIISIVAALTPIEKVSEMCSMGTLLAFAMVCMAVMVLRVKKPELERPYKTPAVYVVGTLGVGFNLFLMTQVRTETWYTFIIWGTLGILVYLLYSKRHSNLEKE
ncbi:MAG: amino acid permease [Flavobacterium sp.]|jgi:APA family basic amino acid/polyamine antiporter|uniref:amino acid permease n=1 Tax=Flavobacterium sp. TaxID=239 RepID=UPI0022BE51B5|nr:amino acid permease [Flavobacterium sp.]MCZ8169269.1 amino acid permease [Flavobacterium sp.]MCZ8297383.1 amino acid permease [Flavobacterium sp.]